MIDLKIKITGIGCWDEETPLELSLEDARKLYEELGKVFGVAKIICANGNETPKTHKTWGGRRIEYQIKIDPENIISMPFGVESATLPKKETL